MPEVLHMPDEVTAVRALRTPDAILDPATAAVLDAAVADAEARGRREGEEAGRRAAAADVACAVEAVKGAVDHLTGEIVAQRDLATRASLELAALVATAVLDRSPPDEAAVVLDRVARAVEMLDVDPVEVRVSPDDHAVLTAAPTDRRLELIADPSVAPGEATIGTAVAGAELTRRALMDAALAALGEGAA